MIRISFRKQAIEYRPFLADKGWIELPQFATVEWFIGQGIDNALFNDYIPVYVQAEDKELDYIVRYFTNIPIAYEPWEGIGGASSGKLVAVQCWHNDFARFIAEHLPRK